MSQRKSIAPGVASLTFLVTLDRISYYGFRGIVVLFVLDEMSFSNEDVLYYYSLAGLLMGLIAFPMGVASDFILKHRNALTTGAVLQFSGYALFATNPNAYLLPGIVLMVLGSALVRPNIDVLLGRLYTKEDRGRDVGFLINYMGVNIGAALGVFLIGLISGQSGYGLAFWVVASVSLIFVIGCLILRPSFQTNELPLGGSKRNFWRLGIIVFGIILSITYWGFYDLIAEGLNVAVNNQESASSLGSSIYQSLNAIMLIGAGIAMILIWSLYRNPSPVKKVAFSFLLFGLSLLLFHWMDLGHKEGLQFGYGIIVFFVLNAIAEVLIGPVIRSQITRLSPIRYSGTVIGLFFALSTLGNKAFSSLAQDVINYELFLILGIFAIMLSVLVWIASQKVKISDAVS